MRTTKKLRAIQSINQIGFFKHSKNYFTGNLLIKSLAVLTLPIFTRLLSTEDYGIIAIYLTAVSVIAIITGLGMEASIRHKYLAEPDDFSKFLGSVVIGNLFFSVIILLTMWFFKDVFITFFGFKQPYLFALVLINCFFQFLYVYYAGFLTYSKQSKKYVALQLINGVGIPLLSIVLLLIMKNNLFMGRIYPVLIFAIVTGIYSLYSLSKLFTRIFVWKWWKFAFLFSLPLIPHSLSQYILAQFDRVIINQVTGASDTGLYSFAYTVAMLLHTLFVGTHAAWVPIFYKNMNEKKYDLINEKASRYIKVILLITILYIIFSKEAVLLLADPKFHHVIGIIPILILSMVFIFLYMMYGLFTQYRKKNLIFTINTFIAGGLNVVLNYIFIPRYGYFAAAYTTLASYIILYLLNMGTAYFQSKTAIIRFGKYFHYLLITVVSVPLVILLNARIDSVFLLILVKLALSGMILLLFYRKDDLIFLRELMNRPASSEQK